MISVRSQSWWPVLTRNCRPGSRPAESRAGSGIRCVELSSSDGALIAPPVQGAAPRPARQNPASLRSVDQSGAHARNPLIQRVAVLGKAASGRPFCFGVGAMLAAPWTAPGSRAGGGKHGSYSRNGVDNANRTSLLSNARDASHRQCSPRRLTSTRARVPRPTLQSRPGPRAAAAAASSTRTYAVRFRGALRAAASRPST